MARRAYWKGYLKLSLVNIEVELYSAVTSAGRLRLNQIHEPSGKRIRYEKVAEGVGPVDRDEIVKGFQVSEDEYVLLQPEELDEIKLESRRTVELVQFVDHTEIDPRFYEKPYYVVPADNEVAAEGFSVIRDALRESEKTALGQIAVRGRDHILAVRPCRRGLLAETLRYASEVRESDQIFEDIAEIDVDAELTDLALELIERKSAPFEPDIFKSRYAEALRDLIEEKRETGTVRSRDGKSGTSSGEVVDLMAALKKSVEKEGKRKKGKTRSKSKSSKAA